MSKEQCNFCGSVYDTSVDKNILLSSQDDKYLICDSCIEFAYENINELKQDKKKNTVIFKSPKDIKELLDKYIIGQELAKRRLSTAIYNHSKVITDKTIEKSNILLIGPTGSGKTAMLKAISKEFNMPLYIEDVSSLTSAGYEGKSASDILKGLLKFTDYDLEKAESAIVLLDEGDKIACNTSDINKKDVNGKGAQQSILKLVEGATFNIDMNGQNVSINTENIIFILAGAFNGIEDIIAKRQKTKASVNGFLLPAENISNKYNEYILNVTSEDIKEYGFIEEFIGRFPIITPLQQLTEDDLFNILKSSKNSILEQTINLFKLDDIELVFTDEAIRKIAKKALKHKTGARALRTIIENIVENAKYECPNSNIKKVIIQEDLRCNYILKTLKEKAVFKS